MQTEYEVKEATLELRCHILKDDTAKRGVQRNMTDNVSITNSNQSLISKKMQEIPPIELSYETYSSHKKESVHVQKINRDEYHIGLLIPKSKKYVAWFTFLGENDVCILLELNREKQIVNHKIIPVDFDKNRPHLALGTFLYGSMHQNFFIIEDVLMYKSFSLRKLCFGQRFAILSHILSDISAPTSLTTSISFVLPIMFDLCSKTEHFLENIKEKIQQAAYPIHNIQYRSFVKIIPYINYEIYSYLENLENYEKRTPPVVLSDRMSMCGGYTEHILKDSDVVLQNMRGYPPLHYGYHIHKPPDQTSQVAKPPLKFGQRPFLATTESRQALLTDDSRDYATQKPSDQNTSRFPKKIQEPYNKERSVFIVSADVQSDIYNLIHVDGKYYTDVAYIPNYKISVFMNSLFRNIKENANLDTMEESDDEDDFNDIRFDKYVNLEKRISMECMYHKKCKRWIPLKIHQNKLPR